MYSSRTCILAENCLYYLIWWWLSNKPRIWCIRFLKKSCIDPRTTLTQHIYIISIYNIVSIKTKHTYSECILSFSIKKNKFNKLSFVFIYSIYLFCLWSLHKWNNKIFPNGIQILKNAWRYSEKNHFNPEILYFYWIIGDYNTKELFFVFAD